jgi:hypothetical protein
MAEQRTPGAHSPGDLEEVKVWITWCQPNNVLFPTWDGLWKTSGNYQNHHGDIDLLPV